MLTDDSGFHILGWLSLLAVAGLGTVPIALWFRLRARLEHPNALVHPVIKEDRPSSLPF